MNAEMVRGMELGGVKLLKLFWLTGLSFLAGITGIFSAVYPFAVLLAAVMYDKKSLYPALAAGGVLGAFFTLPSFYGLALYGLPVVLSLPLFFLLQYKKKEKPVWRMGVIGFVYLLCALSLPLAEFDILMHALSGAAACALLLPAISLRRLLTQIKRRKAVSRGEGECLLLFSVFLVSGLPMWAGLGLNLRFIAQIALLSAAALYFKGGSAAGGMMGVMCLVSGQTEMALFFGIAGFLADFAVRAGRYMLVPALFTVNFMAALALSRTLAFPVPVPSMVVGCLPLLFLPKNTARHIQEIFDRNARRYAGHSMARELAGKLNRAGGVFANLAQVFSVAEEDEKERRMALVGQVASTVCSQCKKYDYCFSDRYQDTLADLRRCAGMALKSDKLDMQNVPASLKARCENWVNIVLEMDKIAPGMPAKTTKNENQFMKNECLALSGMLAELARDCEACEPDEETAALVEDALVEEGISASVSCLRRKGIPEITLSMRSCKGRRDCLTALPRILESMFKEPFLCDRRDCDVTINTCSAVFMPAPRYRISACALREAKKGEEVCGDSYSLAELSGGRQLLAISDGCGSGSGAACESESAMGLLETLLEGGLPRQTAYNAMNRLLMLKSRSDGYSTLDSCIVDLHEGVCHWSKIGAVPGYILRKGRAERIEGDSLPAGILADIRPATVTKMLQPEDVILLVSDGVYDTLNREGEDRLAAYLQGKKVSPDRLCEEVLALAKEENGGAAPDDMTVLAAKIA